MLKTRKMPQNWAKKSERRIETLERLLRRAGGFRFSGEIDGRAFFDLRLEQGGL